MGSLVKGVHRTQAELYSDSPKAPINFRPMHTRGTGANGLFCKKFTV